MNAWLRWQLAFPLAALTLLLLVPAILGTWRWWPEYDAAHQALRIVICLVLAAQLAVAVSIGVRPTQDVPWMRIGVVAAGMLLTCGIARLLDSM